jgi:hypothetical protein
VEFLELVAKKQWDSTVSYGLGVSTIVPMFHSTTNSEWLCLNSESEFLTSPQGTVSIKNPFAYTRPESSPVYISYSDISIPKNKINGAKSLFLFRIGEGGNEVVTVSNYDKKPDNVTTAPPLDCFSRECMTWFNTNNDWYIGLGLNDNSISTLLNNGSVIVDDSSKNILNDIITSSSIIAPSTVELLELPSTDSPYVSIYFGGGIIYKGDEINTLFLYSVDDNDSLVAFAGQFTNNQTSVSYGFLEVEIGFQSSQNNIII